MGYPPPPTPFLKGSLLPEVGAAMGLANFITLSAHRFAYWLCPTGPIPITMGESSSGRSSNCPFSLTDN